MAPENVLVPELNGDQVEQGFERVLMMLKPEALEAFRLNGETEKYYLSRIQTAFEKLKLSVVANIVDRFPMGLFGILYAEEMEKGIIPDWQVERFTQNDVKLMVLEGQHARQKAIFIKGRFTACTDGKCIYQNTGFAPNLRKELFRLDEGEQVDHTYGKPGCGIRGLLTARAELKLDDPLSDGTPYTVYNWVHVPDLHQVETIHAAIGWLNNEYSRSQA